MGYGECGGSISAVNHCDGTTINTACRAIYLKVLATFSLNA